MVYVFFPQICNCGRHHCPLHSNVLTKTPNGPCLLSEYRDEFLHRPQKPVEPIVPKQTNHGEAWCMSAVASLTGFNTPGFIHLRVLNVITLSNQFFSPEKPVDTTLSVFWIASTSFSWCFLKLLPSTITSVTNGIEVFASMPMWAQAQEIRTLSVLTKCCRCNANT